MNDLQIQIEEKGKITTNLEALKADLTEIASRYEGVVVTEETVKVAKDDLATLRKLKDGVETKRKEIKKLWNEPYAAFESEVKAALAIIEKPISEIDKQIKDFAERDRKAKEEAVKKLYSENVPEEYRPYVPYEKVFNEKWLNKSTKESEIIADLSTAVTQVRADISAIQALQSECEEECLKAYKEAGNSLAAAIQRNTVYINAKQAAEQKLKEEAERKAREEAERKAREEQAKEAERKEEEVKPEIKEEIGAVEDDLPFMDDLPFNDEYISFKVRYDDADTVRRLLDDNGIEYTEV